MGERPTPFAPHLRGLINPGVVIAGNVLGGPAAAMGAVWMLGVGPVLDRVLGSRPRTQGKPTSGTPFKALLYLHTALHVCAIATLVWFAVLGAEWYWLTVAVVSTGICSGVSGIIVAHELGHTRPKSISARLARMNMLLCCTGTSPKSTTSPTTSTWRPRPILLPQTKEKRCGALWPGPCRSNSGTLTPSTPSGVHVVGETASFAWWLQNWCWSPPWQCWPHKRRWSLSARQRSLSSCSSTSTTSSTTGYGVAKENGRARCTVGNPNAGGRVGPCLTSASTLHTT